MSIYKDKYLSLSGVDISSLASQTPQALVAERLDTRIHGLCFSPYIEGQGPGTRLSYNQVKSRMMPFSKSINWIRSFSCTEGNELIPAIADESGIKTMVGIWLDHDLQNNELELEGAFEVARRGHADMLAVGNEVLLRDDLTEKQLIEYIGRVKQAFPNIPVGYVDAYFQFVDHPKVSEACDVILANCYPFWEGCPAEHALLYMKEMYRRARSAAAGKRVIISETGWPTQGTTYGGAVPSYDNAIKYFIDTYQWAHEEDIEIFYFSAFDEAWKVEKEGDVGAYWGLWDKDGKAKYF